MLVLVGCMLLTTKEEDQSLKNVLSHVLIGFMLGFVMIKLGIAFLGRTSFLKMFLCNLQKENAAFYYIFSLFITQF